MSSSTTTAPAPIYAVCGNEDFLKRQAVDQILRDVLGDADRSLALSEYDAASAVPELASVLDDLRTLPFLTDRRLVVVREADKFITQYRQSLEEYAESPSGTGVLLLECKSLAANTRLYKRIDKVGKVFKFEALRKYRIPAWLAGYCKQTYGVQIEQPAADKLVDLIGTDLGVLDTELQKLALYVSGRKQITLADVEALVGQQREEHVWNLLSAVGQGDQKKAMTLWEEVCQTDRAAEARAVGGIAFTVRRLLKAKRAQERGASAHELMRELWARDERQLRRELDAFTTQQVEDILSRLLEIDVAAKTGHASVRSSVEKLIVEMSARNRVRRGGG